MDVVVDQDRGEDGFLGLEVLGRYASDCFPSQPWPAPGAAISVTGSPAPFIYITLELPSLCVPAGLVVGTPSFRRRSRSCVQLRRRGRLVPAHGRRRLRTQLSVRGHDQLSELISIGTSAMTIAMQADRHACARRPSLMRRVRCAMLAPVDLDSPAPARSSATCAWRSPSRRACPSAPTLGRDLEPSPAWTPIALAPRDLGALLGPTFSFDRGACGAPALRDCRLRGGQQRQCPGGRGSCARSPAFTRDHFAGVHPGCGHDPRTG